MNKLTAFTTALVATLGTGFSTGAIPNKYAGYALIAATFIQAFQGAVNKPATPAPVSVVPPTA